jgi:hypothetical protein
MQRLGVDCRNASAGKMLLGRDAGEYANPANKSAETQSGKQGTFIGLKIGPYDQPPSPSILGPSLTWFTATYFRL